MLGAREITSNSDSAVIAGIVMTPNLLVSKPRQAFPNAKDRYKKVNFGTFDHVRVSG